MSKVQAVGIIGAGKLGIVLAQLSLRAGYRVYIAGSGDPAKISLSVDTLAPGASAVATEAAVSRSDLVILALPLKNFRSLDPEVFRGKLVIDAMNYWWETDGELADILPKSTSQSEAVQLHLASSRVVKGLNHMGYHHLLDAVNLTSAVGRKAIALASDHSDEMITVEEYVRSLGLAPLVIGALPHGSRLEPGSPAFGANVSREELVSLVEASSANARAEV